MIIYKTLNSNISATTQYNDFVWGDEWGNIWGVGYSTEMSTRMTRAKYILSHTLSYVTIKRAVDINILSLTKTYSQTSKQIKRLITSLPVVMPSIKRGITRLITLLSRTTSLIVRYATKTLTSDVRNLCSLTYKNIIGKIINTSMIISSSTIKAVKVIKKCISSITSQISNKIPAPILDVLQIIDGFIKATWHF